jgi:hypothetical protein
MVNEKASKTEESHSQEELADDELEKVAGGTGVGIQGATPPPLVGIDGATPPPIMSDVISPRDPASGLPTGKRMHKPIG